MLLNDLYTILNNTQTENKIITEVKINAQHEIFKGHFPSQVVLPGVCMIEIAKEILQENLKIKLQLSKSRFAKFLNMFLPNQNTIATFEIEYQKLSGDEIQATITMKNNELVYLKLQGVYKEK